MNLDETREQIHLVATALADGARRLQGHQLVILTATGHPNEDIARLADAMEAATLEVGNTEINSAMAVMDLLRIIATQLEPWAPAPGKGLTIAVAVLRMAADHAELGATMTTAEIIVSNINDFVSEVTTA